MVTAATATTYALGAMTGVDTEEDTDKGCFDSCFTGRFCSYIQAGPSVIVLAVCIIGIFWAVLRCNTGLTITFGLGVLAAIYGVYISCDYGNNKTFAENNEKLEEQIYVLQGENQKYMDANVKLESISTEFSRILGTDVKALTDGSNDILGNIKILGTQVEALEQLSKAMDTSHREYAENTSSMVTSVQNMSNSVIANNKTLDDASKKILENTSKLEEKALEIARQEEVYNKEMKQEIKTLIKMHNDNKVFLDEMAKLKNKEKFKEKMEEIRKAQFELAQTIGRIEALKETAEGLEVTRRGLQSEVAALIIAIGDLRGYNEYKASKVAMAQAKLSGGKQN